MKTSLLSVALLACIATLAIRPATAQYASDFYGYDGGSYHSSTPYEGALRGEAAFMESYGRLLESEARAARDWQATQDEYLANRQMRIAINRQARQSAAAQSRAQMAAYRERTANPAPIRLGPHELSLTGTIYWPTTLLDNRYDDVRSRLNELFAKRAMRTGDRVDPSFQTEMKSAIQATLTILDEHVQTLSAADWATARRFVKGLQTEAKAFEGTTALVGW